MVLLRMLDCGDSVSLAWSDWKECETDSCDKSDAVRLLLDDVLLSVMCCWTWLLEMGQLRLMDRIG